MYGVGNERSEKRRARESDVREKRVWEHLLGWEQAVLEIDDEGQVVATVRPHHRELDRCCVCGRRALGFDLGEWRRNWRRWTSA